MQPKRVRLWLANWLDASGCGRRYANPSGLRLRWVLHDDRWNFRSQGQGRVWNSEPVDPINRDIKARGVDVPPPVSGSDSAAPLVHRQGFGVRRQVAPGEFLHR